MLKVILKTDWSQNQPLSTSFDLFPPPTRTPASSFLPPTARTRNAPAPVRWSWALDEPSNHSRLWDFSASPGPIGRRENLGMSRQNPSYHWLILIGNIVQYQYQSISNNVMNYQSMIYSNSHHWYWLGLLIEKMTALHDCWVCCNINAGFADIKPSRIPRNAHSTMRGPGPSKWQGLFHENKHCLPSTHPPSRWEKKDV